MPRKNEPIRNTLEPKKTLRCLRGMYMFLQKTEGETKTGIQAEKKGWWLGFILRIQKACLVTKKEGLVRGEAQVPASSISENVWTRLKFF